MEQGYLEETKPDNKGYESDPTDKSMQLQSKWRTQMQEDHHFQVDHRAHHHRKGKKRMPPAPNVSIMLIQS